MSLKGRSFLSTGDLTPAELDELLDAALRGKAEGRGAFGTPMAGKSAALVFFNPSLRTRVSMSVAITQLGGHVMPLEIGAGTWDLEHRDGVVMDGTKVEHVKEAVPVLCQYVDLIAVRCFPKLANYEEDKADAMVASFAKHATVPVVNLESAFYHPCQALADMMTIKERFGAVKGKKVVLSWAYHPKPLPHAVPNAFALAAAQCGADLTIAAPSEYQPDDAMLAALRAQATASGGSVRTTSDQQSAAEGAHVIYAKSWASRAFYGDATSDLACRQAYRSWRVDDELMQLTNDGVFMHCLPARRNVVVTDGVLDGQHSVVVQQAGNRLHAQKALLAGIFGS